MENSDQPFQQEEYANYAPYGEAESAASQTSCESLSSSGLKFQHNNQPGFESVLHNRHSFSSSLYHLKSASFLVCFRCRLAVGACKPLENDTAPHHTTLTDPKPNPHLCLLLDG